MAACPLRRRQDGAGHRRPPPALFRQVRLSAGLDVHSQIVAGPQRQSANRSDGGVGGQAQADPLSQSGEAQDGFGQTEGGAGTNARTDAERNIGVPYAKLGVLRQKALRDAVIRLSPKFTVPVEQPRDNDEEGSRRYGPAADRLVA